MQLKYLKFYISHYKLMASFSQVLNPIIGQNSWQKCNDDYDYHQEVANAGFGDMLHDWERNQKYFAALKATIARMRAEQREVHVLDIGTGTGILAMMALKAGADTVTACEAFMPMAHCAERILAANGAGSIRLIKKRSTDIEVGKDMPQKANLLVTEVLDTELIGEGAISIYNHAHEQLLTDDALCIPSRAVCYAQLAQSPLATQWNNLKIVANLDGDVLIVPPKKVNECKGEAALHDVQLSQLPRESFQLLTQPVEIFKFDFQRKQSREKKRHRLVPVQVQQPGVAEMIFYWWQIEMDNAGDILLSCAPYWAHPDLKQLVTESANKDRPVANVVPWRDHWMQAIYYIPKPPQLRRPGDNLWLNCNHDEFSLWFDVHTTGEPDTPLPGPSTRHTCDCDLHMTYSRSRIGQINQAVRSKRYLRYLEETIREGAHVLVLGNGCILGLATAKFGASSVICVDDNQHSRRLLQAIAHDDKDLKNVKFIEHLEQLDASELAQITHVFAEPYFMTAILPWDNFYFGTLLLKIQQHLAKGALLTPSKARIYALPVEFLDLHKIRMPVRSCEGFDLTLFDEMVQCSMDKAQSKVEAQPLWEYPCRALAQPQEILTVDFKAFSADLKTNGSMDLKGNGPCNGIALWVEWQLDDRGKIIVGTGPTTPVTVDQFVQWDMFVRQGVHFIQPSTTATTNSPIVDWMAEFKPLQGFINFSFSHREK